MQVFFKKKKYHKAKFWYIVMFLSIPQKRIIYIVCSYVHAYACLTTPTYLQLIKTDRERKIDDVRNQLPMTSYRTAHDVICDKNTRWLRSSRISDETFYKHKSSM